MDRWQLTGYRGGRVGSAPPYAYGGRDPISPLRGGGMGLPDRGPGIGMGHGPSPGLGGFHDPFSRRGLQGGMGGRLLMGRAPYMAGPAMSPLRPPMGRDIEPRLALAPGRRFSSGADPLYYNSYEREREREEDCDCRTRGLGLSGHHHTLGFPRDCNCGSGSTPHAHSHSHSGHSHSHHRGDGLGHNKLFSEDSHRGSNCTTASDFDFPTKDIAVRGKTYSVRCSYLAEASKFEADLQKYVDKKSEKILSDRIIEMLISFINRERYGNDMALDEVTMNVLCTNVTAKSAFEHSLKRLQKYDGEIDPFEMSEICATILCSDKVDDKLKDWLKKYMLKVPARIAELDRSQKWAELNEELPEVRARLAELLGLKPPPIDDNHRIL